MKIIYKNKYDTAEYDESRFIQSLERYGTVDKDEVRKAVKEKVECYPTPHVSVLVRVGVGLIKEEEGARKYYEEHKPYGLEFERLRRITGYLVGTLNRWNDGKQAEERDRVKHSVDGVYTQTEKAIREEAKLEQVAESQI